MTRIVPANKFIRKGVDEGEYAAAGTTENLRKLRRRVQGTAEKGLGAAGRTPTLPARAGGTEAQKVAIAQMLDQFGVDYLELTSPCASPQSEADLRTVAALPLQAKVLTHVRCHLDDARVAVGTGADGIDVLFGTSSAMRAFSHG